MHELCTAAAQGSPIASASSLVVPFSANALQLCRLAAQPFWNVQPLSDVLDHSLRSLKFRGCNEEAETIGEQSLNRTRLWHPQLHLCMAHSCTAHSCTAHSCTAHSCTAHSCMNLPMGHAAMGHAAMGHATLLAVQLWPMQPYGQDVTTDLLRVCVVCQCIGC